MICLRYFSVHSVNTDVYHFVICSSAIDQKTKDKVAIKKLYRPFESLIFAKRAYREVRLLRHIQHDNVSSEVFAVVLPPICVL